MTQEAQYKRVLLKLSGESFKGQRTDGIIDPEALSYIAEQLTSAVNMGVEVGVVVGGGNIWRGSEAEAEGMDRASADYAGMLATVINAVTLQDVLEREFDIDTRTQTALSIQEVAEPYIQAPRHPPSGKGQGGDLRRRHWQPLRNHRHGRRVTGETRWRRTSF